MIMIKVLLMATLGGSPALSPTAWTLDGKAVGNRHTLHAEVTAGQHTACATIDNLQRCRVFRAVGISTNRVILNMDPSTPYKTGQ